ncbi:unnamed protein product, partial [Aphanomyces euteiches]
ISRANMTSSTNSKRTCPFEDDNTILKKVKTSDQSNTCSKRPCPFDEGNASIKKPKTIATLLPKSNDEVSLDDHDAKRDSGKTYAQSESKHVRFTTQTTVLFEVAVGRNLYVEDGVEMCNDRRRPRTGRPFEL